MTDRIDGYQPVGNSTEGTPPKGGSGVPNKIECGTETVRTGYYTGVPDTESSISGIYCQMCGTKTYLADNGTHRRCPECDDL